MKIVLVFILLFSSILANDRAKIALVLSGGGARGGAHVGVLKVLQEKKIPIDFIVATSMGSFVGGLYATGKTPQEIEEMLVLTDWREYIRTDFNRRDIPMRRKEAEFTYQGKLGLGINAKNELVTPTGILKRQPLLFKFLRETQCAENIKNFDDFSIPFRAVATNIKNGDSVVLKSGSLAKAIYASSSIPGGLQPINIDGIDLVDGGVSNNFPIELAREMGADIIIAVDVSENFDKDLRIDSYFVVMGQLVNILMRKNANESISKLNEKDILLTPELMGFSGLDADQYIPIIQCGTDVAQKVYETKLKHLSLSDADYAEYEKKYRVHKKFERRIIDAIEVDNTTYLGDDSIIKRLHIKVGDELDEEELRKDLMHLYNMMLFDSVEYSVKNVQGKNILVISTRPSWDNHGEVRFSIGIEDDFRGHSAYSLKIGYTMFGLNEYAGEFKNDFEIGRRKKVYTEIFQPFDSMQRYYIRPSLLYSQWTDLVPASKLFLAQDGNFELELERYGTSLALGAHVTTDYEFEVGASYFKDSFSVELLNNREEFEARPIYISAKTDDLDNIHFPKVGLKAKALWTKEVKSFGSDYDYEQVYFEFEKPLTMWSHNITSIVKYGNTYKNDITSLAGTYTLGGLFNLSGYIPYSFNNDNMFLGLIKYSYELKDGGFFGALNTPLYVGFSAEVGNTWTKGESVTYDSIKKSGTIYVAADTFLGPFYLAYGFSGSGEHTAYLYLGEKF